MNINWISSGCEMCRAGEWDRERAWMKRWRANDREREKRIFYPMENGSLFRSIRTSCCHAKFSTHTYGGLCMHMIFSHRQVRKVEIKIQPQYLIIRFFPFQQRSRKNEYQQILLTIQCELLTLIWHTSLCFSLSFSLYGIFL